MRRFIVTMTVVLAISIMIVVVLTYAPEFIPTTVVGQIGAFAVTITTIVGIIASVSQILDTYDRYIEQHRVKKQRNTSIDEAYQRYREVVLRTCEVIDLTELPVLVSAMTTMQEFTVQQLYIPLRLCIDVPAHPIGEPKMESLTEHSHQRNVELMRSSEQRTSSSLQREISIGALLQEHKHVMILGDPGSGKSTLVKWLAMALLLRDRDGADLEDLPDGESIPSQRWIPILVRCRDIDTHQKVQVIDDLLVHSLRFRSLQEADRENLRNFLAVKIQAQQALLIIDGLDEILDTKTRTLFARRLQEIAQQHPELPMVITSRGAGYKEMRVRFGSRFKHATIADLKQPEKEQFSRNWVAATVPEIDRGKEEERLVRAINSTEDIARITNTPLLLTIMAIVHRKLHRLPHRRAELYRYFMQVLYDFNPQIYDHIDEREAEHQLGYLAFAMELAGSQQMDQEVAHRVLSELRDLYLTPAIGKHAVEEFLDLIEKQTSIVVQKPLAAEFQDAASAYEFKHETFKHYFAGLALAKNLYPGSSRSNPFSERIKFIFEHRESITRVVSKERSLLEWTIKDNWREVVRLSIASMDLNNAETALLSILNMQADTLGADETQIFHRMCITMAAICLADEPNVGLQTGREVIQRLLDIVVDADGLNDRANTSVDEAVLALSQSQEWHAVLTESLLTSLETFPHYHIHLFGSLYILSEPEYFKLRRGFTAEDRSDLISDLSSGEKIKIIRASLAAVNTLYLDQIEDKIVYDAELDNALLQVMNRSRAESIVASWALSWLWLRYYRKSLNRPLSSDHVQILCSHLLVETQPYLLRCISDVIGMSYVQGADFIYRWAVAADSGILSTPSLPPLPHPLNPQVIDRLYELLQHPEKKLRISIAVTLARLGSRDDNLIRLLFNTLDDKSCFARSRDDAVEGLARIGGSHITQGFVDRLESEDEFVQTRSMLALIGLNTPEALSGLCQKLKSDNPKTRYYAAAGLAVFARNKEPKAIGHLEEGLVREKDQFTSQEFSRVLKLQH